MQPRQRPILSGFGPESRSRCIAVIGLAALAIPTVGLTVGCGRSPSEQQAEAPGNEPDPVVQLEQAIQARDWERADRYDDEALIAQPNDPALVTKVAAVHAYRGRKREAALLLVDAATMANYRPASRVTDAIQALIDVGEIYTAIELLEASLKAHPDANSLRRILVGFLGEVQRGDQIPVHLKKLIRDRSFDLPLLIATTETSSRRLSHKTAKQMFERNPDDHRVRLPEAFLHLYRRNAEAAADVLEEILEHHPDFAPAHAMYGQALATASRWDEIPRWLEQTPSGSRQFADYWLTLGDVAIENGMSAQAARAYWEAAKRDTNRVEAWDGLRSAVFQLRQDPDNDLEVLSDQQLDLISQHLNRLLALRERFNDFEAHMRESQSKATEVAKILFSVGRLWEAEAWTAVATTLAKDPSQELASLRASVLDRLRGDTPWIDASTPVLAVDLSELPEPRLDGKWDAPRRTPLIPRLVTADHLRLAERTAAWGLASIGEGNNPSDPRLGSLIRSTGVGGGAIDYDLDGQPDLLAMNAGGTMLKDDSQPNELMRNIGDAFVRATQQAGVGDTHFGQGVAVGDFNEDGFADLFFANLGSNVLLRNNGDGTFTDVSARLESDLTDQWSTSASFLDIDQDSIADLVVTGYCQAMPNIDQACPKEDGRLGPCHPMAFPAERDQVFRGTADGRFANMSERWIGSSEPGRGLGVIAGALGGQQLAIYVANDMTRNAYYTPERGNADGLKLRDSAAARGVAVDGSALAQASMGIAASDFDRDGDLDLYVTGFGREYNIYYEQTSPGLWKDETGKLNLIQPTLTLIGFGTEAIDLDNDGIDEIVVTNGHIGEFSEPGSPPYEQEFQVFRRGADGRFVLLDDDSWGDYFGATHVGRALWTTDVNRDGRNDVFVTHSDEQISLLVNESEQANDVIAFRLVATDCSRDAVGAVIRFQVDGQNRTLWQLSGDGYFCSNEKTLIAGLGTADTITDVTVTWQDGSVDRLGNLESNHQYLIVQGQGEAFPQHHYKAR